MKKLCVYRKVLCVVFIITTSFLYAHGDLTKRINEKTLEISKDPKNPNLYFERGFLYEQHEEFQKAIHDYLKSEKLGNSTLLLQYRKAQTYYSKGDFSEALDASNRYLERNRVDVKIHKLHAQILIQQKSYKEALNYYSFFIENSIDATPDDVIEYSTIYLAIDPNNYSKAIEVIDTGLRSLGGGTFSLQLKKLEYLEVSDQINAAIEQYNYFIINTNRKEFWYYKKAKYLFENKKYTDSKIAVQQAKIALIMLSEKFKKTSAIKSLKNKIHTLEKTLSNEN